MMTKRHLPTTADHPRIDALMRDAYAQVQPGISLLRQQEPNVIQVFDEAYISVSRVNRPRPLGPIPVGVAVKIDELLPQRLDRAYMESVLMPFMGDVILRAWDKWPDTRDRLMYCWFPIPLLRMWKKTPLGGECEIFVRPGNKLGFGYGNIGKVRQFILANPSVFGR